MVAPRPGDLVELPAERARELLLGAPWVRVAFSVDGLPEVMPVNLVELDGELFFLTSPGTKLGSAASGAPVALQADGGNIDRRTAWSAVAHGSASIVTDPGLEERLFALPFTPWAVPLNVPFWVRVEVRAVTGRELIGRPHPETS